MVSASCEYPSKKSRNSDAGPEPRDLAYAMVVTNSNLSQQTAVSQQQAMNQLGIAVTAASVSLLESKDLKLRAGKVRPPLRRTPCCRGEQGVLRISRGLGQEITTGVPSNLVNWKLPPSLKVKR